MREIRNCNVCVVGGAGFLGSHLVNHLIENRGCHVLVIDNLASGKSEFINGKAAFEHHDITGSEGFLLDAFKNFKMLGSGTGVDYVFDYAAMPYIPDSFRRPLRVFDVNAFGAMKVINAAQEAGVKGILQVSSAEIYGEAGEMLRLKLEKMGMPPESQMEVSKKIDEGASVIPHSSYGAAKAAIDAMVQVRWKEAQTPVMALRQFNCIGERETHPYIVPEIISQLARRCKGDTSGAAGTPIIKLGNNSYRDFMYAGDAVRIATLLLERGEFGEVYNLGSEAGIKMYDLAKLIGKLMGFKDVQVVTDEARVRPYEIWHLQSDNTKIRKALGPDIHITTVSFNEALERTIQYFKDNGSNWSWETK